jgi:hypothetical protein
MNRNVTKKTCAIPGAASTMSGNIAISPTAICKQLIMDLKKHYKMHKNVKDAHSV